MVDTTSTNQSVKPIKPTKPKSKNVTVTKSFRLIDFHVFDQKNSDNDNAEKDKYQKNKTICNLLFKCLA